MSTLFHTFDKHSTESYSKTINFLERLPTGADVSSCVVHEAIDLLDGVSYASGGSAVVGSPSTTTTSATVPFIRGTDGHTYRIVVKTTLSNSNVLTDVIDMKVCDRP